MTPQIKLVAYADRDPAFVFVAVPNERGRYLRTDHSVIVASCEVCGSAIGEPCSNGSRTNKKYHVSTHYLRRRTAMNQPMKLYSRVNVRGVPARWKLHIDGTMELLNEGTE